MEITRPEPQQPRPSDAQKVFSGIVFDVYHWEQEVFDGSTKTFEQLKRRDTTSVIAITEDKKIIMAKQTQPGREPYTGPIGGGLDNGEHPFECANRELLEETGYVSDNWSLYYSIQPTSKIDWVIHTFIAKDCRKVAEQSLDGAEIIELFYLSLEQFIELAVRDDFVDRELKIKALEAKADPAKLEEMKQLFFGQ